MKNKNFLLEQIEACHKRGIKCGLYNCTVDGRIMREHPEWLAVDENGEFIDTQGVPAPHFYHTICLNSGYRQFFKDQLQDMIEVIGVENLDGIFMDILFQVDCKCEHCVRKMQELGMDTESKVERMRYAEHMLDEFKTEISEFIHSMAPEATIFTMDLMWDQEARTVLKNTAIWSWNLCQAAAGDMITSRQPADMPVISEKR